MTSTTTVLVTNNITSDTTWKSGFKYIIGATILVSNGVTLTIQDRASVCFLSGTSFNLVFEPGSRLNAGVITSFGVDSSYNPVTVANSGGWKFWGTKSAFYNGVIPVNTSRFTINQIDIAYIGSISSSPLSVDSCYAFETNFNVVNISNTILSSFVFNSTVNFNRLSITNATSGLDLSRSTINVLKSLTVTGGNFINSIFTSVIVVSKCARFNINSILSNLYNIITSDTRVPTTKPYANPYVVNVQLKSKVKIFFD